MNLNSFLGYAKAELQIIKHPYSDVTAKIKDIDLSVWIIDSVLRRGSKQHKALAENFYQALRDYLNTPRYQKAILRGAIEKLAVQFEGFLRITLMEILPEKDIIIYGKESESRGRLSQSGYLPDFLKALMGTGLKFGEGKPSYWQDKSVEDAVYGVCFRHQQRAKHESRDYMLSELESLAVQILGAYLFFSEWLMQNSDLEKHIRERRSFAANEALLYWPQILEYQLGSKYINPYDHNLQETKEKLMGRLLQLTEKAKQFREQGIDPEGQETTDLYQAIETLALEYEWLITDSDMREYGRDMEAGRYE